MNIMKLFGYEMHTGTDLLQFYDTDETLQNIGGYLMMEKVKYEDIKKILLEKGIW